VKSHAVRARNDIVPEKQYNIRLKSGFTPTVGEAPKVLRLQFNSTKLADELPLLRYMSLSKFVNMLTTSGLWFSRQDLLGDPFEGAAPISDLSTRSNAAEPTARIWEAWRRWLVVSCWYTGPIESDAMWNKYAPNGEGLAIKTSVSALRTAMKLSTGSYADSNADAKVPLAVIFLGQVFYGDHDRIYLKHKDLPFARAFLKRPEFPHEQEVRAVAPLSDIFRESGVDLEAEPDLRGITVTVNITKLLDEVIISPTASDRYFKDIEKLLRVYEIEVPTRVSDLAEKPRF
jgi:hypothetical protein